MPKILLTGGSGFIGSYFHRILPQENIINFDLVKPPFDTKAKFVIGDIRKKKDVEAVVEEFKIDLIISLAAKHHDFGIEQDEYYDTNRDGTRVICEVAAKKGIDKIIYYSSVAVYGLQSVYSTEESIPKPDHPYGGSKLAGEKVLQEWCAEKAERQVIVIRPTVVYGPGNLANMFSLIKQIDRGFYFNIGKADNIKSIAYVENLVEATLFLLTHYNLKGLSVFNYADGPQLTTKEITTKIAEVLNRKIRFTLPLSVAVALGKPFDFVIKVTGKNLPISSARIKKLATATQHSAPKIKELGFVPTFTTLMGLEKMVRWYKVYKKQQ
jgi:nucleoside-diphosphate-sugar epimerase